MSQVIQVELQADTTHTVTWLDAALKPRPGMALICKGDPRSWIVVHAYGMTAHEVSGINMEWKIGALLTEHSEHF